METEEKERNLKVMIPPVILPGRVPQ